MRFLTCADSEADTAVGCDGEDGGEDEEEEEELKGLRPPKDILHAVGFRRWAQVGWEKSWFGDFQQDSRRAYGSLKIKIRRAQSTLADSTVWELSYGVDVEALVKSICVKRSLTG
jgi:hypothetical protein